jgi:hypothetical protein
MNLGGTLSYYRRGGNMYFGGRAEVGPIPAVAKGITKDKNCVPLF